ncbi:MAG: hypothetical protein NVS2B5_28000 [Beijerinckiaceae bacterium]
MPARFFFFCQLTGLDTAHEQGDRRRHRVHQRRPGFQNGGKHRDKAAYVER